MQPPIEAASPRAKRGPGRPRERLPDEVIERLGPCPTDPARIRLWNARLLGEVQILSMRGLIACELAASLRANAGAIDRALPESLPVTDDDDESDDDGPQLEDTPSDGGIRVG